MPVEFDLSEIKGSVPSIEEVKEAIATARDAVEDMFFEEIYITTGKYSPEFKAQLFFILVGYLCPKYKNVFDFDMTKFKEMFSEKEEQRDGKGPSTG